VRTYQYSSQRARPGNTTGSGFKFGICTVVSQESLYLRAADPNAPPDTVELAPFVKSKCLSVYALSGDKEQTLYVDYAADLDDGEAMTLALAFSRGFTVATMIVRHDASL